MQTLKDLISSSFIFSDLQDEERNKMINELADIAVQRTVIRALEKMSDAEVTEFENTIGDSTDPAKVFNYLESQVPSFYDMLKEEVMRLQALAAQEQ
jgi:flagellar motor switch protein FliG